MLKSVAAPTHTELCRIINGLIAGTRVLNVGPDQGGSPIPTNNLYKHPIAGLTITWSSGTHTFASNLTFKEIITALNFGDDVWHLHKADANGGLVLALWNDIAPVTLSPGTANAYFGLPALLTYQSPITDFPIMTIGIDPVNRCWVCFYTT